MEQSKNYSHNELTDDQLQAVTGGVNAPATKTVTTPAKPAPKSPLTPAVENDLMVEAVALRALSSDLNAKNVANVKQDLQIVQDALNRVNHKLK